MPLKISQMSEMQLRPGDGLKEPVDGPALDSADTHDLKLVFASPPLSSHVCPTGGRRNPSCLPHRQAI